MRSRHTDIEPLVNLSDITEIELIILKRMREVTLGDHRSRQHGSGFDFIGLRDWQAGDKFSSIDWGQSSLNNFSPLVIREFEQPSNATVVAIVDKSLSMRCGVDGVPIAAAVARALATVGLSAVFFQDPFGIITFDQDFQHLGFVRPRTGKGHVVHCLDAYQHDHLLQPFRRNSDLSAMIGGYLRSRSMLPVISDFLFDHPEEPLRELALLNATHDVFIVLIDSSFAFHVPRVSSGWIQTIDVETGRAHTVSRAALAEVAERAREHQDGVVQTAKALDLDVVRIGLDQTAADVALSEFVSERRLRKTYN
jgi:uncharacterized protein (DUF58 family)